jgi:RNA-dependent RNA polymerase
VCVFFSYLCFFSLHNICSDKGQISGKVLVYRNPGLHFGDIHVLKATYVEALESFIGNAKYAIFFPCKGPRSLADEIAGGDFDGDMYWVSRNPQVGIFISFSFR